MAVIVAEIGQNHLGDMRLARTLIGLAKVCGADMAKFQLYDHKALYESHPEIPNVELSFEQAKGLFDYGKSIGIEVFFSVFDVERVKWCETMGVKRYKIAFSQRHNKALVEAVQATGKPVIISSSEPEFADTLYCVPEYPAMEVDFSNLEMFDGFSDHTIGLDAVKMAIDLGAKIIEKHFALDHNTGIDAPWSMIPQELKSLRRHTR